MSLPPFFFTMVLLHLRAQQHTTQVERCSRRAGSFACLRQPLAGPAQPQLAPPFHHCHFLPAPAADRTDVQTGSSRVRLGCCPRLSNVVTVVGLERWRSASANRQDVLTHLYRLGWGELAGLGGLRGKGLLRSRLYHPRAVLLRGACELIERFRLPCRRLPSLLWPPPRAFNHRRIGSRGCPLSHSAGRLKHLSAAAGVTVAPVASEAVCPTP